MATEKGESSWVPPKSEFELLLIESSIESSVRTRCWGSCPSTNVAKRTMTPAVEGEYLPAPANPVGRNKSVSRYVCTCSSVFAH